MITLATTPLERVVTLGAHCDDIAIGAGGTLLTMCARSPGIRIEALVLCGGGSLREAEERAALRAFCPGAELDVTVLDLPDGRLPAHWGSAKTALEDLRERNDPDVLLVPSLDDSHQDHRGLARLARTVWRNHLILGYEIAKWDADRGSSSAYVPLTREIAAEKVDLLEQHYQSQHHRSWYDREAFLGLARLRGIECQAHYAEAFELTKALLRFAEREEPALCASC